MSEFQSRSVLDSQLNFTNDGDTDANDVDPLKDKINVGYK
jgi:hypothetical protein